MIIVLTTLSLNRGWKYEFSDGEKAIVNFANVAEARTVDVNIKEYAASPDDPASGTPTIAKAKALAVMFNSQSADGDALIFYYKETMQELAKKLQKASATVTEFYYHET